MKRPTTLIIFVMMMALLVPEAAAMNTWLKNYLTGMDQLMMLAWRNIYYYTWLIIPKWMICAYFWDLGKDFYDKASLVDGQDDLYKEECKKGMQRYYDAVYYGGNADAAPYAYFKSFYKPT